MDGALKEHVESLFDKGALDGIDEDALARLLDIIVTFITVIAVQGFLGTLHLEGTVKRVLDDEEFMTVAAHALLATMLYAATGNHDWPDRLAVLHSAHGEHPIVGQLVRSYALAMYRFGNVGDEVAGRDRAFSRRCLRGRLGSCLRTGRGGGAGTAEGRSRRATAEEASLGPEQGAADWR